ncbi:MAG TPA: hypothetical protein VFP05_14685 [Thermomicrobiales bacterium]|nr:hypothetical protein [Thermomicrobiales bacterium]
MRQRFERNHLLTARVLIWAALSALLLWYLRWGSELVAITPYYHIRRSAPYIWNAFHKGLPDIGNETALDIVYWSSITVVVVGVLALFWLALTPSDKEAVEPADEQPPA